MYSSAIAFPGLSQIEISLNETIREGEKERKPIFPDPQLVVTLNGTVDGLSQQSEK
jgi:hypothetical protein